MANSYPETENLQTKWAFSNLNENTKKHPDHQGRTFGQIC